MRFRDLFFKKDADLSWKAAEAQVEARRAGKPTWTEKLTEASDRIEKAKALAHNYVSKVPTASEKRAIYLELVALVGEREADRLVARERRIRARANRA